MHALSFFIAGSIFGLAGGFSPGPTTILVVSQTLRFGFLDGIKVALAPALTDAPIILVAVLPVGQISRFEFVLGVYVTEQVRNARQKPLDIPSFDALE